MINNPIITTRYKFEMLKHPHLVYPVYTCSCYDCKASKKLLVRDPSTYEFLLCFPCPQCGGLLEGVGAPIREIRSELVGWGYNEGFPRNKLVEQLSSGEFGFMISDYLVPLPGYKKGLLATSYKYSCWRSLSFLNNMWDRSIAVVFNLPSLGLLVSFDISTRGRPEENTINCQSYSSTHSMDHKAILREANLPFDLARMREQREAYEKKYRRQDEHKKIMIQRR